MASMSTYAATQIWLYGYTANGYPKEDAIIVSRINGINVNICCNSDLIEWIPSRIIVTIIDYTRRKIWDVQKSLARGQLQGTIKWKQLPLSSAKH